MLKRISHLFGFYVTLAWRSVSDTGVYLRAALLPGRLLIIYTLLASLLIALGHSVRYRVYEAPILEKKLTQLWQEVVNNWPQELRLQYSQGRWEMTPNQTLTVEYPQAYPRPDGWPSTLATLESTEPSELTSLPPSLVIAGPTTLLVRSSNEESSQAVTWESIFTPDQTFDLTKQSMQEFTPTITEWIKISLNQLSYLILLWWFLIVWLARLFGLLLYAWLAQALWTLRGRKLRYATVYKMGLLIMPVAELLMLVWKVFWPSVTTPLSFWWIWLLIMIVIVLTAPRKS